MENIIKTVEIVYIILFTLVVIIICFKGLLIAKEANTNKKALFFYPLSISIWFILSLLLSFKGFFKSTEQFSKGDVSGLIYLIILMCIPIVTFFVLLNKSKSFEKAMNSISLKFIIFIQLYRILGVYFIILLLANRAPALFALPAGLLDILIGISAPFVAFKAIRSFSVVPKIWNYIGILDFIIAFSLYFLYFPFKIIKISPDMIMWGGFFPVAFIVMFIVPLSTILHVLAIKKINNKS